MIDASRSSRWSLRFVNLLFAALTTSVIVLLTGCEEHSDRNGHTVPNTYTSTPLAPAAESETIPSPPEVVEPELDPDTHGTSGHGIGGDIGMNTADLRRRLGPPDHVSGNAALTNYIYNGQDGTIYSYGLRNDRVNAMMSMRSHETYAAAEQDLMQGLDEMRSIGRPVRPAGNGAFVVQDGSYNILYSIVADEQNGGYDVWTIRGDSHSASAPVSTARRVEEPTVDYEPFGRPRTAYVQTQSDGHITLRNEPRAEARRVVRVVDGTTVAVLGCQSEARVRTDAVAAGTPGHWCFVRTGSHEGWAFDAYLVF